MAERTVTLSLLLKDQFSTPLGKVRGALKNLNDSVDELSSGFDSLRDLVTSVVGAFLGFEGLKKLVNEARESEEATTRLTEALHGNAAALASVNKLADELSEKTFFSGDELKRAAALIAQIQGGTQGLSDILQTATDLAAQLGGGVEDAARQILSTKELGKVGPELAKLIPLLKALDEEQLRAGKGIEIITAALKGRAEALANTSGGRLTQFTAQFNDELAKLGGVLLDTLAEIAPTAIAGIRHLREGFQENFGAIVGFVGALSTKLIELAPLITKVTIAWVTYRAVLLLVGETTRIVTALTGALGLATKAGGAFGSLIGALGSFGPAGILAGIAVSAGLVAFGIHKMTDETKALNKELKDTAASARDLFFAAQDAKDRSAGIRPAEQGDLREALIEAIAGRPDVENPDRKQLLAAARKVVDNMTADALITALSSFQASPEFQKRLQQRPKPAPVKPPIDENRIEQERLTQEQIDRVRKEFEKADIERSTEARKRQLDQQLENAEITIEEFQRRSTAAEAARIFGEAAKIKAQLEPLFQTPESQDLFGGAFELSLDNAQKIVDKLKGSGKSALQEESLLLLVTQQLLELKQKTLKVQIAQDAAAESQRRREEAQREEAGRFNAELETRLLRARATIAPIIQTPELQAQASIYELLLSHQRERIELDRRFNLQTKETRDALAAQLEDLQRLEVKAARVNAVRAAASEIVGTATEAESQYRQQVELSAQLFQSGQIGGAAVFDRNRLAVGGLEKKVRDADEAMKGLIERFKIASSPELAAAIAQQRIELDRLKASLAIPRENFQTFTNSTIAGVESVSTQFDQLFELGQSVGERIGSALGDGISGALVSIVQRTQSVKDAFRSLAASVLADIGQMIIKFAILRAVSGFLGAPATTAGGFASASPLSFLGFAQGGQVPGADTGRDDRLVAVRGGEFMLRPEAAQHYGLGFLHNLNDLIVPPSIASGYSSGILRHSSGSHFAKGGQVPASGGGGQTILPVLPADRQTMQRLLSGGGDQEIAAHMRRNPQAFRAALGL